MNDLSVEKSANKLIQKLLGPASETIGLMINDWAKVWRYRNLVAVMHRIERIEQKRGEIGARARIEPRIAVPAIEAISLEDNEDLQELWANLLYESLSDSGKNRDYSRTLLRIAKDLDPLDIPILQYIYGAGLDPRGEPQIKWVEAREIKEHLEISAYENGADDSIIDLARRSAQHMVAVSNLMRIGLIEGALEDRLRMTPLGMQFMFSAGQHHEP